VILKKFSSFILYKEELARMKYWIEVASGDWAWTKKIVENSIKKRGLKAPAQTRYINMLSPVMPRDCLLTYLTTSLTENKNWRSSIVGISIISSDCYKIGYSIFIDTSDDTELPAPIKFQDFSTLGIFSQKFQTMISRNFQKYLFEIEKDDFVTLCKLKIDNYNFLMKTQYKNYLD
jgi:hypothetical protein